MANNPSLQFYTVYHFMAQDLRLRGAEKEVFAIIYGYARSCSGVAEVSITRMQLLSGISRDTIVKAIAKLIARNYIKNLDTKGKRNANRYVITAPCISPTSQGIGLVRNSDQSEKLTSHWSTNPTSTSQLSGPQYNVYNKKKINTQLSIPEGEKFNGKTTINTSD